MLKSELIRARLVMQGDRGLDAPAAGRLSLPHRRQRVSSAVQEAHRAEPW